MSADHPGSPPAGYGGLLAQAFDAAPNGFVLADDAGRIITVNQDSAACLAIQGLT